MYVYAHLCSVIFTGNGILMLEHNGVDFSMPAWS